MAQDIAPYAQAHRNITGPGDGRPTALQVVQDQQLVGKLKDVNVLITGGNTGLGKETTRALHATGAQVFIMVPPGIDGTEAAHEIALSNEQNPHLSAAKESLKPISVIAMDLGSFTSIDEAVAEFKHQSAEKLNILICNAGVMSPPFKSTQEGHEPHFGINYLGHFYLFKQLADTLISTSKGTPSFASRVVIVSSLGHRALSVDFDDFPPGLPDSAEAKASPDMYMRSKTMLIWMANEIERRYAGEEVHALSLNPGSIVTPLTAHIGWEKDPGRHGGCGEGVRNFDEECGAGRCDDCLGCCGL